MKKEISLLESQLHIRRLEYEVKKCKERIVYLNDKITLIKKLNIKKYESLEDWKRCD